MRKIYTIVFSSALLFACNAPDDPITRKWTLKRIDASELVSDLPAELRDTIQRLLTQETATQKGKTYFDIREGGRIVIYSPDLRGQWEKINGKWIYNPEAGLLTVEMKDKRDEYIVHKLDENVLSIELVDRRAESSLSGVVNGRRQGTKIRKIFR